MLYSLVTMDITRKQLINVERAENQCADEHLREHSGLSDGDMRVVVRPNFDTLYSSGWLDLTKEPVVASVPDTGGRYYLLPMLDMWTDVLRPLVGAQLERPPTFSSRRQVGGSVPAHSRSGLHLTYGSLAHQDRWPAGLRAFIKSSLYKITPLSAGAKPRDRNR
jgi:hypothetical protein